MKVCSFCSQCSFSKCYSVSWKNGMKGFIFSLPPCECILSGERRSGVTAWPLIGRHQPVEKVRMMHGADWYPAPIGTYLKESAETPARGAGSNPAVPTLQWMEILRFVTLIQGFLAEMRGIFACRNRKAVLQDGKIDCKAAEIC